MCLLNYAIYVFIMDLHSNNTHYFILFSSVKHVCCMALKSSQWWFKDNLTVIHCV